MRSPRRPCEYDYDTEEQFKAALDAYYDAEAYWADYHYEMRREREDN